MASELATWDEARAAWQFSLGTHDHGDSDICDCEYTWACPTCGEKVTSLGESMGDWEVLAKGECMGCAFAGEVQ